MWWSQSGGPRKTVTLGSGSGSSWTPASLKVLAPAGAFFLPQFAWVGHLLGLISNTTSSRKPAQWRSTPPIIYSRRHLPRPPRSTVLTSWIRRD